MTIAVCIPAYAPRLDDLLACIEMMQGPEISFVVVTNEPQPIRATQLPSGVHLVTLDDPSVNLSRWWNKGHLVACMISASEFMVTESDCRMTYENVLKLRDAMYEHDLSMVGPNLYGWMPESEVSIESSTASWGSRHPGHRICQTWMVRTEETLPADERFVWWVTDEQHEMRHRSLRNGTGIVGASVYEEPLVQTTNPEADDERREGNILARKLFLEEWGFPSLT